MSKMLQIDDKEIAYGAIQVVGGRNDGVVPNLEWMWFRLQ